MPAPRIWRYSLHHSATTHSLYFQSLPRVLHCRAAARTSRTKPFSLCNADTARQLAPYLSYYRVYNFEQLRRESNLSRSRQYQTRHRNGFGLEQAAPAEKNAAPSATDDVIEVVDLNKPSTSRAILFFALFATTTFGTAAYWSLKQTNDVVKHFHGKWPRWEFEWKTNADEDAESVWGPGATEAKLFLGKRLLEATTTFGGFMHQVLGNVSPDQRSVIPIIAVNATIFLLWFVAGRISSIRPMRFMFRNFTHRATSGKYYTMLTSAFSHQEFWHFSLNNISLWSFGAGCVYVASHDGRLSHTIPEANSTVQFLAFFATAGVFAAMTSHVCTRILLRRAISRSGQAAVMDFAMISCLGSSGAIWSTIAMTACTNPDAQISIIFLPFISFPMKIGTCALLAIDVLGIIRKWRFFDHYAHLGGALFGVLYYQFGPAFWERIKDIVASWTRMGPYDTRTRKVQ